MAYFKISRNKKGELQAKIQVSGKDVLTDKLKLYTKRVYNKDNLTEAKFKKFAERQALAFEDYVKKSYSDYTHAIKFLLLRNLLKNGVITCVSMLL